MRKKKTPENFIESRNIKEIIITKKEYEKCNAHSFQSLLQSKTSRKQFLYILLRSQKQITHLKIMQKKIAVLSTIITDYNLNFPTNLKRIKTPFPLSIRIEIPKVSSFYRKTQNPSKQVVQDYHKIIKLGIINENLLIISRFKKKTLIKISPWQFGKQW